MSDCGCSKKVNSKKATGQIVIKRSGNPGSCLCGNTLTDQPAGLYLPNHYRATYTIKPISDITTSKIKFWLGRSALEKEKPPHSGVFSIWNVDGDGKPTSLKSGEASFDIPAGLSVDGQEFEATFSSVTLSAGTLYGLCWEFVDCSYLEDPPDSGNRVYIRIASGHDDTCSSGLSKPYYSQRYNCDTGSWPDWGDGRAGEFYYCLGVQPLAVETKACTEAGKTFFTANGEVMFTGGYPITTRGFEYGEQLDSIEPLVWSEDGEFGVGEFSHKLEGLMPGTVYVFRAFACGEGI